MDMFFKVRVPEVEAIQKEIYSLHQQILQKEKQIKTITADLPPVYGRCIKSFEATAIEEGVGSLPVQIGDILEFGQYPVGVSYITHSEYSYMIPVDASLFQFFRPDKDIETTY